MIERVENGMMVLKPIHNIGQKQPQSAMKIDSKERKPAEDVYNPELADKINVSRQSIAEEMSLLKNANLRVKTSQTENNESEQKASPAESLEALKRNLSRIESLLYQVASVVAAADPDSMAAMQKKLAEEVRGYKMLFRGIDLHEIVPPELNPEDFALDGKIDTANLDLAGVEKAKEIVNTAEAAVDEALEACEHEQTTQSATEAALSSAEQNLAAAESTYYPEDVLSRAKEVSSHIRGRLPEAIMAHGNLQSDDVFKLISTV